MQPVSEAAAATNAASAASAESTVEAAAPGPAEPKPELTLDLHPEECACEAELMPPALTSLDKGFKAMSTGDYVEAVQHFKRHRKRQDTPTASWEAGIGIAYASMLTNSPLYDAEAARKSYRRLKKQTVAEMRPRPHQQSILMAEALETFVVMDRHIADLENTNATLKEDLAKREEAIKRLRELTLGQTGPGR